MLALSETKLTKVYRLYVGYIFSFRFRWLLDQRYYII